MEGTGITAKARREVLMRDSFDGCPCCVYCGNPYNLHLHHVVRRSQGGQGSKENLITLCWECHTKLHAGETDIKDFCMDYLDRQYGGE